MSEISAQLQAESDRLDEMSARVAQLEAERDELRRRLAHSDTDAPAYLAVEQAAALVGCNPRTIRRAVSSGRLRAFRPAGRMLFSESDVRAWVESKAAIDEVEPRRRGRARSLRAVPGSVADLQAMERELSR